MQDFLIFVAPFIVLFGAIALAFWAALKDGPMSKKD
ncbi:cytochrome bd oxidase small subunit CydS [Virgibacillus alimentarius]|uniref:Cbb3-type cytochrome oxidase assembly protein CcoS n=1 Tax=Virgibacillus alimentarius TaxID=698769 RepID=A0ABS4S8V6_9BACI|nr:hypothetical protein [Virgibacillus alimentarius]